MERPYHEQLKADLMGLTKEDLAKAPEGFAKLKENLATLTPKAKKTVQQQRKSGPGALKKAGTALRKDFVLLRICTNFRRIHQICLNTSKSVATNVVQISCESDRRNPFFT